MPPPTAVSILNTTEAIGRRGKGAMRVGYTFCTTEGESSGGRTCKRCSAKHLKVLPSLLEGRRSLYLTERQFTENALPISPVPREQVLRRINPLMRSAECPRSCESLSAWDIMQAERIESMSEKNETVLRKTPLFASLTSKRWTARAARVDKRPPDSSRATV